MGLGVETAGRKGVGGVYELLPRREQTGLIFLPLCSVSSKEPDVGKEATDE